MHIGDKVKTNENWNRNHKPITGKITDMFPAGNGVDQPIAVLDHGKHQINVFWLVKE